MSYKRHLRRLVKRDLQISDEKVNQFVEEYVDRESHDQSLYDMALCQTLLAFAMYQRFHEHHGKRKIAETVSQFHEQMKKLRHLNTTLKDARDKLEKDCGYDFWQQMEELGLTEKFVNAFKAIHGKDQAMDFGKLSRKA